MVTKSSALPPQTELLRRSKRYSETFTGRFVARTNPELRSCPTLQVCVRGDNLDGINSTILAICPNRIVEIPIANCAAMRLFFDVLNRLYSGHAITKLRMKACGESIIFAIDSYWDVIQRYSFPHCR